MSDIIQLPVPQPAELLEQLAQDPQTSGLANLTQRLVAAIKIPMQARSSSDQAFGGVSDITNRGNFDRLLLSELAHDDLSLMARLANNEALYLRREELPSNDTRQRFILIDTSIKMWGTPRVFAIATALACRINNKEKARISNYALQGNTYSEIELFTKADIIGAMAELSPALHSARGLTAFTKEHPLGKGQEYFLITEEQLFYKPAFQAAFAHLRTAHGFLITVSRSGQLQLFKYTTGNRRLLLSITLDLPELLSKTNTIIKKKQEISDNKDLPAFMNISPAPLYFPSNKIRPEKEYMYTTFAGIINITQDQRLLYWPDKSAGARELLPFIQPAKYYFGQDPKTVLIYILMHIDNMPSTFRLLQINTVTLEIKTIDIKHDFDLSQPHTILYNSNLFVIENNSTHKLLFVNPYHGNIFNNNGALELPFKPSYESNIRDAKRFINNGYNVLNRVLKIEIDRNYLMLDSRTFIIDYHSDRMSLRRPVPGPNNQVMAIAEKPVNILLKAVEYKLEKFEWDNGCEAFLDSRGFLHLRCPDKPEVTIVLILNRSVACWASDGAVCGTEYFTGTNPNKLSVQNFYDKYIQSFIDALK